MNRTPLKIAFSDIRTDQHDSVASDYSIRAFESVQGQASTLEAVWTVRKSSDGMIRSGRTVASEPVQGQGFDALAAAHSLALAKMSGDIAASIRVEAEQKS